MMPRDLLLLFLAGGAAFDIARDILGDYWASWVYLALLTTYGALAFRGWHQRRYLRRASKCEGVRP